MPVHDWPRVEPCIYHDLYVGLPLESTYQAAYQGMPSFWRDVLEGK